MACIDQVHRACAPALGIQVEPHGVGGLGVLDPRLPSHPPGASFSY